MACQQGLTFRSTAQMATSEAGGRAVTRHAWQPPALTALFLGGWGPWFSPMAAPGSCVSHHSVLSRGFTRVAVAPDGCHRASALVCCLLCSSVCIGRCQNAWRSNSARHHAKGRMQGPTSGREHGANGGTRCHGEARAGWGSSAATLAPCPLAVGVPTACLSSRSPWPSDRPSSFSSQIYSLIWSSSSLEQRLHQSLPGTARHVGAVASAQESSNNH